MVPDDVSAIDLIGRLGGYDVVVVDVDDTLVRDGAPALDLAAGVGAARRAAGRAGVGRLLVVSNGSRSRAAGVDGVIWQANKPWTRSARLGISSADVVAVVGDRLLPDGLLARRWGADFYLVAAPGERLRWPSGLQARLRRLLFTVEALA